MSQRIESVTVLECPACGRALQTSVEMLGQPVGCRHCGKTFIARDRADDPGLSPGAVEERADRLLILLDTEKPPARLAGSHRQPHRIDGIA